MQYWQLGAGARTACHVVREARGGAQRKELLRTPILILTQKDELNLNWIELDSMNVGSI